jgi:tetratricopeptide (TPR) repeat protein
MRLSWNGCTATEAMTRFRKAQESDQQGDTEGAERQFREALAAFEHLLSPTHEDTKTAAYSLAAFYARNGRMQEANNVLDWMSERHVERWGVKSKPTIDHVLRVVDLLNSWLRPQDAHAFLEKAKDDLCQPDPRACGRGGQNSSNLPYNGNAAYQLGSTASSAFRTTPPPENSGTGIVVNPSSTVDCQLRSAETRVKANDELVEPLLLSIIAQCKLNPDNLAAQNLRARAALIELYRESGRTDSAVEELSKAQALFLDTWELIGKISREFIDASLEVAAQSLKSEQYNDTDEMFQVMQERVCETFGPDHSRTIRILIRIGLIYQNGNRWKDAEPRFEQALAASMAANGLEDALTRTLEAALENQHYSFIDSDPEDFVTIIGSRGMRISPT